MELLLGEHGEGIIYGIIGIFMVFLICSISQGSWRNIIPNPYNLEVEDSDKYKEEYKSMQPKIQGDEVIFVPYKNNNINLKDYIVARDYQGGDISNRLKFSGKVDTSTKGIYRIKCSIEDNYYRTTKVINIVVE